MPANLFYVNLAIADFGFNTIIAVISISLLIHDGAKPFGDTSCYVQAVLVNAFSLTSFDCIGSIASSRYIIIVHPGKKLHLTWKVCIGVY